MSKFTTVNVQVVAGRYKFLVRLVLRNRKQRKKRALQLKRLQTTASANHCANLQASLLSVLDNARLMTGIYTVMKRIRTGKTTKHQRRATDDTSVDWWILHKYRPTRASVKLK